MSKVYLVGAGPGDPGLITVRGREILRRADAVLYDHLANPSLLAHAPPHAQRIYVGKKRAEHVCTQDEIIAILLDLARAGKTVVRLKGGDPFIFGRGGEEVEALAEAGVAYEVVPGVTAPLGIAATTGVPLTHREHTSVVTFVTGHDVDAIDWSRTGLEDTLVIFMGLMHLGAIVEKLIAAGRSPDTPAMAVRWGTRPDQCTIAGRMAELPDLVAASHLQPPATVIIGDVVSLRDKLGWFEKRPLFGQRVIVTRASDQAAELCDALRELGADAVALPVIELAPLEDYSALDACIARLHEYDWIVFTSVNAVSYFFSRNVDARKMRGRICAIGPATAKLLRDAHLYPDLVPDESTSEGIAAAFGAVSISGARVLLPRAAAAREVIPEALGSMGAHVDVADAYRNVIPTDAAARIAEYLRSDRRAHWITFTSGSTVNNWLALAGRESLQGVRIASIGPATSEVVRKHGFAVDAEADPHTVPGLIQAIIGHSDQFYEREKKCL
jgi:uroporphyrinogen III methyltransferase/synthase